MPKPNEIKRGREIGKTGNGNKHIWHPCVICGKFRWVKLRYGQPVCLRCRDCYGSNLKGKDNPNWRGGRHKTIHGYVTITLAPDNFFYPMVDKLINYIPEHRLVMAQHLNRCLLPWEVVHHKNGIKDDNRLENLELIGCSGKHNTTIHRQLQKQSKEIERLASIIENQTKLIKLLLWHCSYPQRYKVSQDTRIPSRQ